MARLSKAQSLAASEREFRDVPVPELGEGAYWRLRSPTASEVDQWEKSRSIRKGRNLETNWREYTASLLALCIVDDDAKPEYTTEADIRALGELPAKPLRRAFEVAKDLAGLGRTENEDFFSGSSNGTPASVSNSSSL